jgi:hypothetical protein
VYIAQIAQLGFCRLASDLNKIKTKAFKTGSKTMGRKPLFFV